MRLAIYNEPPGGGIGGSEYCAAVLAAGLADEFEVELIHHRQDLTVEAIWHCFGEDVSGVSMRYIPPDTNWMVNGKRWWLGGSARRRWKAELSEGFDALITICHWIPPYCQADMGILYVLFPLVDRLTEWPWGQPKGHRLSIKAALRRMYFGRDWRQRFGSYDSIVSISEFTRKWTKAWWGYDSSIIYPPVDLKMDCGPKENVVLAIGRFCEMKRQLELVQRFVQLSSSDREAAGWRMFCCGNPSSQSYYTALAEAGDGGSVELVVGAEREEIKRRLATSKIFWHAAGFGVNAEETPGRLEHFGIATVEAMAAGCVPVVIAKGGQPEIVEHGVSGFTWNTLEELEEYTLRLIRDDDMRRAMSEAARRRAQMFSKERFIAGFRALVSNRPPTSA